MSSQMQWSAEAWHLTRKRQRRPAFPLRFNECQEVCCTEAMTAHERYGELYSVIQKRDSEMAHAFDDCRYVMTNS